MEELRQTAFAYYKDAPEQIRRLVDEFFLEIDHDGDDRVSLHEFLTYMEMHEDCTHLSNPRFFDELKKEASEELDFLDVVTLFYIVYSGKPFCNGDCKKFVKGVYFTCVKCFDHASDAANTFNVCTACYVDGKYVHGHKKFLDNFLLLQTKRMEALNQLPASSIHESKSPESGRTSETSNNSSSRRLTNEPSSSGASTAVVPVNSRPKNFFIINDSCSFGDLACLAEYVNFQRAGRKALKTIEVLLALGNIFASTQCTIM
ncbi:hypothetical protein L3X38_001080 [Prunus dulcis]|uniref:EF-hand domain-containing protein n=1 Tax=Prunus dulcis TaxID=3755 RepID=A0AAD4WRW0_PRUDU|nr:hypothetical protein L3X38_001080 [Prunus dulcis]